MPLYLCVARFTIFVIFGLNSLKFIPMKIRNLICLLLLLAGLKNANILTAQTTSTNNLTPNGVLDSVYDQYGLVHQLSDLMIGSTSQSGNSASLSAVAATCVAGYFTLHFGAGLFFDNNIPAQTVACQVFSDISLFINSSIPSGAIHIFCGTSTTGLGVATSYFVFPNAPINPNQGYTDNLVYRALTSGVNPYSTLPIAYSPGGFYHAALDIYPLTNGPYWNYNLTSTTVASNEHDLYCVILHEVTHMLGFTSVINFNGTSLFGTSNNFYTRYDQFLKDNSGSNLLAPSSTACPNANVTFVNTATNVALGGNCSAGVLDATTCSIAARYVSSINQAVYTPTCYESGSSLSHFEDMCTTFTSACVPTPATPGYNNLIFVMSNKNDPGSCYVKRNLHPYEKQVLCDLGYSLNSSYGSTVVAGSQITYTSGCSSGLPIGVNDGISAGNYVFVTTTNSAVISSSALLNNDISTSSASVSCLEALTLGSSISGGLTNCTLSATTGTGLVIFKYYPVNSSGYGNVTYVFVYFLPAGCSNGNSCNLIRNSGFENTTSAFGNLCGPVGPNSVTMDCWENYTGTTFLLSSNCTLTPYVPGVNTFNSAPATNTLSFGSVSNSNFVTLQYSGPAFGTNKASIKNLLNGQLQTGQTYNLSFFGMNMSSAFNSTASSYFNPDNNPIVVTIASHPNWAFTPTLNFPSGLNVISSFVIQPSNMWSLYTNTFVYTPAVNASAVIIGINVLSTSSPTNFASLGMYYFLLDEFQITPYTGAFAIPQSTLCGTPSYTNLANYTGTLNGTFFGQGVTQSGANSLFNSPPVLPYGNYPVGFTYTNGTCSTTLYQNMTPGACCTSTTIPEFTYTTVTTNTTLSGTMRIASDFTVQGGAALALLAGDFMMTNNSKITVANGGVLTIRGSHLYACGADLWKGIKVQNGGYVYLTGYNGVDNLLEDAIYMLDVSTTTVNSAASILDVENTTFNKNYVDVYLSNFPVTSSSFSNAFRFRKCVFTCRNLPYTSTIWPQTSTSDLRAATNPTTGLDTPYLLGNAPIVNLKNPYSSSKSKYAIQIKGVGTTNTLSSTSSTLGFLGINIGEASAITPTSNFNLFDAHESFIHIQNSNVNITNCVFQNTQTYSVANTITVGAGILFTSQLQNYKLDLSGVDLDQGNRFWNCHRAIYANNPYEFFLTNSVIRSTQANTISPLTFACAGQNGVLINSNRIVRYAIDNNLINNVSNAISIGLTSGAFQVPSSIYNSGNYLSSLSISNNTISAVTSTSFTGTTTNYVSSAISISDPLALSTVETGTGITVNNNLIYRVYNGINLNGISVLHRGHYSRIPKYISNNNITLEEDLINSTFQKGIAFVNTQSWDPKTGYLESIDGNTLTLLGGNNTNTNIDLEYHFNNITSAYPLPYIVCNTLSSTYNGFVFDGPNFWPSWRGNDMSSLQRGMSLLNGSIIMRQGASGYPIQNRWLGTWSGSNYSTWVDASSNANRSPLYTSSVTPFTPINNFGLAIAPNIFANGTSVLWTTGGYTCGVSQYAYPRIYIPTTDDFSDENLLYIARSALYRNLFRNDSLRNSDSELLDFYNSFEGGSIAVFADIHEDLINGFISSAETKLSSIYPEELGLVEMNYYSFYNLYLSFVTHGDSLSHEELYGLKTLANQCAGTNGASVYYARALYRLVTGIDFVVTVNCATGSRQANTEEMTKQKQFSGDSYDLVPNPSTGDFVVMLPVENEVVSITIHDISGKVLFKEERKGRNFLATVSSNLINGLYTVSIQNSKNEIITKKLVVQK